MKSLHLRQLFSYLVRLEDSTRQKDIQPVQLYALMEDNMIWIGALKTLFWVMSAIAVSILAGSFLN